MKTEDHYYHVTTPEESFTFIGGPTKPGGPGKVWLTTPAGEPVLEVLAG